MLTATVHIIEFGCLRPSVLYAQVKSLKTPPKGVKLTMEVCCLMFDVKPNKVKDPESGKKV